MADLDADRARKVLNSRAYLVAGRIAGGLNKPTKLIFKGYAQRVIEAAENTLERELLGAPVVDARVRELEAIVADQARLLQEQAGVLADQSEAIGDQSERDDALQREIERGRAEQDQLRAEFEAMKRQAEVPLRPAPFPPVSPGAGGDTDANAALTAMTAEPMRAMTAEPMRAMTAETVTSGAFMMGIGGRNVPVGHHGRFVRQDVLIRARDDEQPIGYEEYDARVLGAMDQVVQRIRGLVKSSLNQIEHPRDILDADNADAGTIYLDLVVIELSLSENLQPTRPHLQITYDRNMELKRHAINALENFEFRRGDRGRPIITSTTMRGRGAVGGPTWNY